VGAADGDDAGEVGHAVAVEDVVGGAGADIEDEHAVLALFLAGDHVAGGEAGEDDLVDVEVEAADDVEHVADALLVAVDGPVADLDALAAEVLGIGDDAAVDAVGTAELLHEDAAGGQFLALGEIADAAQVGGLDHVVGGLHVHGGFVVEALEVAAALGEEDDVDVLAGLALGLLEGAVGAVAGGAEVDDAALHDAAGGALAAADDGKLALVVFADEDGDFRGADFDGADVGRVRAHVWNRAGRWETGKRRAARRASDGRAGRPRRRARA